MEKRRLYPLTHGQKGLWYTEQFYPGTSIGNITSSIRLWGDLDYLKMAQVVNALVENNDALRLHIVMVDGEPQQYVAEYTPFTIDFLDFSDQGGIDGFNKWAEERSVVPFNLLDTDLYYFCLYKTSPSEGGLFLLMNHLISDAWTMLLFANIGMSFLGKLLAGEEWPKLDWPSYLDHISSQQAWENSLEFKASQEYWQNVFAEKPNLTPIKPKPVRFSSINASRSSYWMGEELTGLINKYSEDNKVSPFNLFLSILTAYLGYILSKDDVIIGIPILTRNTDKERLTMGMFIDTVPVRLKVDWTLTFKEFTEFVAETWRQNKKHRFPYDLLLQQVRDHHKTQEPLYDVVLSVQTSKINLEQDFEATWFVNKHQTDSLFISLNDRNKAREYQVDMDYLVELFDEDEIDRYYMHFANFLRNVLICPDRKLSEYRILTDAEEKQLLIDFNNTRADYRSNKTIHQLFEEQSNIIPDQTALVFNKHELTYKDLNSAANRLARTIRGQGVKPGDKVGLLTERSIETLVGILAILKAGGAYVPLDPAYPKDRIRFVLEDSGAKLLLAQGHILKGIDNFPVLDINQEESFQDNDSNLKPVSDANDLAYLIYTSGSTGTPKGALIRHKSVVNFFNGMKEYIDLKNKVVLSLTTVAFDIFVFETLLPLIQGSKVVIATEIQQLVPEELRALIRDEHIDIMQLTPSHMKMFMGDQFFPELITPLSYIVLGGEPVSEAVLESVRQGTRARIINGYGPSEATIYATMKDITDDIKVTIGKPITNTRIYILDEQLRLMPIGYTGEIYIGGEGVAVGYLNRPDITSQQFVPNPFNQGEIVYRTGDLGRWTPEGNIEFVGRKDHQEKVRGFRIELGEIESCMLKHPVISEAVVITMENEIGIKNLVAYLVAKEELNIDEIRNHLAKYLPNYMIPVYFVCLDSMPLTPNGKIDRNQLSQIKTNSLDSVPTFSEPRNKLDRILAREWRRVLGYDRIGIDDNFFELGGESLKIVKILVALLPYDFGLTARDFYKHQTIRTLSDRINGIQHTGKENEELYEEIINVPPKHNSENIIVSGEKFKIGNVMLTGGTGFLGAHVIKELMDSDMEHIYCLIRGDTIEECRKKLFDNLNNYFPDEFNESRQKRINVVKGDITLDNFGMSDAEYVKLGRNIDTVIHGAANVKHYGGYPEFKRVNVDGTERVLNFCKSNNIKLNYISSTTVSGQYLVQQDLNDVVFTENDFYIGQKYLDNVYVRSKFEAERMIIKAMDEGVQATIFRVGILTGRFKDGQFQTNMAANAFYNKLRSIIELRAVPYTVLEQIMEFTPVDYCSKALVKLLQTKESSYKIFHLVNHNRINIDDFIKLLNELGYEIEVQKGEDYIQYLRDIYIDNTKRDLLTGIIADYSLDNYHNYKSSPIVDSSITVEYLNQLDFRWPPIDLNYIARIIENMVSEGFIEESKRGKESTRY